MQKATVGSDPRERVCWSALPGASSGSRERSGKGECAGEETPRTAASPEGRRERPSAGEPQSRQAQDGVKRS